MKNLFRVALGVGVGAAISFAASTAPAWAGSEAHAHIGHVGTSWNDTPDQKGLLQTAMGEAQVAAAHAGFAAGDLSDLASMQLHMPHVRHALDPSIDGSGPGLGYGFKNASSGIITHITLAAEADGASDNVKLHAVHINSSANNGLVRAEKMLALVTKIEAAKDASTAAPLVTELNDLAQQLAAGFDANGDGNVGWEEGEGGLDVIGIHLTIMADGEGLDAPVL